MWEKVSSLLCAVKKAVEEEVVLALGHSCGFGRHQPEETVTVSALARC